MMYKAFFNRALARALAGAGLLALAAGASAADDLVVENAWLRAVPPVSPTMAGYFELRNKGDRSVKLEGAEAEFAGMAMLHGTETTDDGQRRMVHLGTIRLDPGDRVSFKPGGNHLMLMKLSDVPRAGETVEVCLTFTNHDDVCADFQVRHNSP
ncbi:copper chaperone PCu(A)C [Alcanivorax sp. MM125-6]|nr:copper chaperone PCu(A)C [Alcanivorax sp. MM125-6]